MRTTTVERLAWMRERVATPGAVRAIRETAGLSQRELAAALNVTQAAVSRWERGERVPRGQPAQDYARVLERLTQRTPVHPSRPGNHDQTEAAPSTPNNNENGRDSHEQARSQAPSSPGQFSDLRAGSA